MKKYFDKVVAWDKALIKKCQDKFGLTDYTPMEFVVGILRTYFHKTTEDANAIMLDIHKNGKGIAGIYPLDIAETKLRQVIKHARKEEFHLTAKLESE